MNKTYVIPNEYQEVNHNSMCDNGKLLSSFNTNKLQKSFSAFNTIFLFEYSLSVLKIIVNFLLFAFTTVYTVNPVKLMKDAVFQSVM